MWRFHLSILPKLISSQNMVWRKIVYFLIVIVLIWNVNKVENDIIQFQEWPAHPFIAFRIRQQEKKKRQKNKDLSRSYLDKLWTYRRKLLLEFNCNVQKYCYLKYSKQSKKCPNGQFYENALKKITVLTITVRGNVAGKDGTIVIKRTT